MRTGSARSTPAGVGKSNILTALVFSLVKPGNRLAYIPDCRAAAKDPWNNIRIALLFAFNDHPDLQCAIAKVGTLNGIRKVICILNSETQTWMGITSRYIIYL